MRCKIFNCDKVHGHRCCAMCDRRSSCKNPCQNHPTRCGQTREETRNELVNAAGIRFVNATMAEIIIETREPRGLFIRRVKRQQYVGIDNRTGDAWTEDFPTRKECLDWLMGAERKE